MGARKIERPFSVYSSYYDLLYADKDYKGEASFIAQLIERLIQRRAETVRILDLACGTGRHAIELARKGYQVEGADVSVDMIRIARKENAKLGLNIKFYTESFQSCGTMNGTYDAVLAMFSAIDYLTSYEDLALALRNISSLLADNGVFIFDFWNGNAVVRDFSPLRFKRMGDKTRDVLRISKTSLDVIEQRAKVIFHFMILDNARIVEEFDEEHRLRYFYLQEMADFLRVNGFEVVYRCPFLKPDKKIVASDWNVTYVARKASSSLAS